MKFLKNYYRKQLIKAAQPSTNVALDSNASVTVIHGTEEELATVKRYFNRAQGVRWIKEKRSKEQAVNSSVLYLNDINLRGEPAIALPMMTVPGFNLTFHRNDGVTFGLLGGAPWWSLVVLALAVCAWLAVMMLRTRNRIEVIAFGSILGGALGNVVDRLRYRAVTDFLDFYVGTAHWHQQLLFHL